VYTKDLTSLLQLLKVSEQTTLLRLEPPEPTGEEWYALLSLVRGDVTRCQVLRVRDEALLFDGPAALRWLITLGRLSYEEMASPLGLIRPVPPPPQTQPLASTQSEQVSAKSMQPFIQAVQKSVRAGKPHRTTRGDQEGVAGITEREHRQVFLLVDGLHTPEEIADLLHKSPDRVRQVLVDLQRQGRIE